MSQIGINSFTTNIVGASAAGAQRTNANENSTKQTGRFSDFRADLVATVEKANDVDETESTPDRDADGRAFADLVDAEDEQTQHEHNREEQGTDNTEQPSEQLQFVYRDSVRGISLDIRI